MNCINSATITGARIGRLLWLLFPVLLLLAEVGGGSAGTNTALQFNGSGQYVTFGAAPTLGASTFTLEVWFNQQSGCV